MRGATDLESVPAEYDAYVVEYSGKYENKITNFLDDNRDTIAEEVGEGNIYIKTLSFDETRFESGLDTEINSPPVIFVFDTHPVRAITNEKVNKCVKFELGRLSNERDAQKILQQSIFKNIQQDEFMNSLCWEAKKKRLVESLPMIINATSVVVSIVAV
jgi:hypothetical protein